MEEYFNTFRLNFKNWKLVDLDNYMKGNPHFKDFLTEPEWNSRVNETLGSSLEESSEVVDIKNHHDMKEVEDMIQRYYKLLEIKEPKSNVRMHEINAEKKAKEKALKHAEQSKELKKGNKTEAVQ